MQGCRRKNWFAFHKPCRSLHASLQRSKKDWISHSNLTKADPSQQHAAAQPLNRQGKEEWTFTLSQLRSGINQSIYLSTYLSEEFNKTEMHLKELTEGRKGQKKKPGLSGWQHCFSQPDKRHWQGMGCLSTASPHIALLLHVWKGNKRW